MSSLNDNMSSSTCPFCSKTIRKKQTMYENDTFMVFTDEHPVVKPHVMVITKRHVRGLIELNDKEWLDFKTAYEFAYIHVTKEGREPFMFVNAPQDQSVHHLHIHILPGVFGVHGVDKALRNIPIFA